MPYNPSFYSNLKTVNDLLDAQNVNDAILQFIQYLIDIRSLGNYGINWQEPWREEVFRFGAQFSKSDIDARVFLDEVERAKASYDVASNMEILDFIFSEIVWNFYTQDNEYVGPILRELIKKYPQNPEFHMGYAFFSIKNLNYQKAISEGRLAYKIEKNERIKRHCFNNEKKFFDNLIQHGKIGEAKEVLDKMSNILGEKDWVFNNVRSSLYDRVRDHELITKKIGEINELIFKASEKERNKLIEVLGIFVAILSFIFINVNIALHGFAVRDIFILMLGMADILMLFAVFTSFLFSRGTKASFWGFAKSYRFWMTIILMTLLFIIFHFYT